MLAAWALLSALGITGAIIGAVAETRGLRREASLDRETRR